MKKVMLSLTAAVAFFATSCKKDVPPTIDWNGINVYRFEYSKQTDNFPYGQEGNLLRIAENDSVWWDYEYFETLGTKEVFSFTMSDATDIYIAVQFGETSDADYKTFEVFRNDTSILKVEGAGQLFVNEYFQIND